MIYSLGFVPRNICRLPGGPGSLSILKPADCMLLLTTPLAQ